MKIHKLLLLFIFLSLPLGTFAHWEEDADDEDPAFGTDENPIELDEVTCTADDESWWKDDYDDWYNDNYWYTDNNTDTDDYDTDEYKPTTRKPNSGNSSTNSTNQGKEDNASKVSRDSLNMAVKKAVLEAIRVMGMKNAACNIGVNATFKFLFHSNALNGMRANEMVKYWMSNPNHWQQISMSEAQTLANNGYFVVAGWINPTGGSGHVVVVVPGDAVYLPSWKSSVPNVMDTGHNKRTEKQLINMSFGPDKRKDIVLFKYKK